MEDEEARGEFWPGARRVRGCRRPAGAEGRRVSSFGPSPRENVGDRRGGEKGGEGMEVEKRKIGEKDRRGATSRLVSRRLREGGRGGGRGEEGGGDQRRQQAALMELLRFWMLEHGDTQTH